MPGMGSHFLEIHELHSAQMVEMIGACHACRCMSISANEPDSLMFDNGDFTEKCI
jgi:Fe-S cluster biogenesis protein NfuA